MKALNIVRIHWRRGTNEITVKARGYKGTIYEPSPTEPPKGINAFEWFLGALGACITTMLHYHAGKAGIERLDEVAMRIIGETNLGIWRGDLNIKAGPKEIIIEVKTSPKVEKERLERALDIAKKLCPISDVTVNPTKLVFIVKQ